jgi:hypothetical protein
MDKPTQAHERIRNEKNKKEKERQAVDRKSAATAQELKEEQLDQVASGTQSTSDWRCHIHPS